MGQAEQTHHKAGDIDINALQKHQTLAPEFCYLYQNYNPVLFFIVFPHLWL
jgi:hypothetical protein